MSSTKLGAMLLTLALHSSWTRCQSPQTPDTSLSESASSTSNAIGSTRLKANVFSLPPFRPTDALPALFSSSLSMVTSPVFADPEEPTDSLPRPRKKTVEDEDREPVLPARKKIKNKDKLKVHPFSTVAFGIRAGSLGAGAEIATPLSRTLNLRASVNYMSFRYSFRIDGINYYTRADFRSGQVGIDWFPFHGGFHISPGYMYFNTGLAGAAKVTPGQSFVLDSTTYINSVDDPVGGAASITYSQHYAPVLMFGFSNIIPRTGGHFSMPFEFGAAYTHAPVMAVDLAGTACTNQGCFNAGNDPDTQANLKREVNELNESVSKVPVFPIVTLGIAVRF